MINLIVDASKLIYSSYFTLRDSISWWMVWGVLNSLLSIVETEKPDTLTLVWGSKFIDKQKIFPLYRTGRSCKIDFDQKQFSRLVEICSCLNICQLQMDGVESDQLIAALTNSVNECIIISEDKDFFQLLTDKKILKGKKRGMWNSERVEKEFGLKKADMFADYLALVGDPIDKIPRIVLTRDAVFLVNNKGYIEDWLLKNDFSNIPERIVLKLKNNIEQLKINYTLVNLRNERFSESMVLPSRIDFDLVKDRFNRMGMKSFLKKFNRFEELSKLNYKDKDGFFS